MDHQNAGAAVMGNDVSLADDIVDRPGLQTDTVVAVAESRAVRQQSHVISLHPVLSGQLTVDHDADPGVATPAVAADDVAGSDHIFIGSIYKNAVMAIAKHSIHCRVEADDVVFHNVELRAVEHLNATGMIPGKDIGLAQAFAADDIMLDTGSQGNSRFHVMQGILAIGRQAAPVTHDNVVIGPLLLNANAVPAVSRDQISFLDRSAANTGFFGIFTQTDTIGAIGHGLKTRRICADVIADNNVSFTGTANTEVVAVENVDAVCQMSADDVSLLRSRTADLVRIRASLERDAILAVVGDGIDAIRCQTDITAADLVVFCLSAGDQDAVQAEIADDDVVDPDVLCGDLESFSLARIDQRSIDEYLRPVGIGILADEFGLGGSVYFDIIAFNRRQQAFRLNDPYALAGIVIGVVFWDVELDLCRIGTYSISLKMR